ncbi:MAG: hypothetical protein AAFN11_11825 [Chloroflexota bacterium]
MVMGATTLSLKVGVIAQHMEHPTRYSNRIRRHRDQFTRINQALATYGLEPHTEPESLKKGCWSAELLSTREIHCVRWIAAYLWHRKALPAYENPDTTRYNPLVKQLEADMYDIAAGRKTVRDGFAKTGFTHLVVHADDTGYYLPIDFDNVIFSRHGIDGGMIGSSYRLREECAFIAQRLKFPIQHARADILDTLYYVPSEKTRPALWQQYPEVVMNLHTLYHAANASITRNAALVLGG